MLNKLFSFFKKEAPVETTEPKSKKADQVFSTDPLPENIYPPVEEMHALSIRSTGQEFVKQKSGTAMDSTADIKRGYAGSGALNPVIYYWYAVQGYIGWNACAVLLQHWMIYKACNMPARDALRKGYELTANDGDEIDPKVIKKIRKLDKKYNLKVNCEEFITLGRGFGIRIAKFEVESSDPRYYEKPFNIDGVTEGSYKGIIQIDPNWIMPELNSTDSSNPNSKHFQEPTYWLVNGERIHRSHLVILRTSFLPDVLKPSYIYAGVSIPQRIYERVYAAERTANEGPKLALTKRNKIYKTAMAKVIANQRDVARKVSAMADFQDNHAISLIDKESEDMVQFDVSLNDLDAVIMTQYQIVSSITNIPATKLLGISPKGLNSTGEGEMLNYHEELESIQEHEAEPLLERHYQLCIRSDFPGLVFEPEITWKPLKSLSKKEVAEINEINSRTGNNLSNSGAIDGQVERSRIIADETSGYYGLEEKAPEIESDIDEEDLNEKEE